MITILNVWIDICNRMLRAPLIFWRSTVTVTICKARSKTLSWATKGAWTVDSSCQMLTLSSSVWVLSTLNRRRSDTDRSPCLATCYITRNPFLDWLWRWVTQVPISDFELSVWAGQSRLSAGLRAVSLLPDLAGTRIHMLPGKTRPPFPYVKPENIDLIRCVFV